MAPNTKSIHSILPLELVLQIMQSLVAMSPNKLQVALQIAQLDMFLRSLVLDASTFWDTFTIKASVNSINLATLYLSRSKDRPLNISVDMLRASNTVAELSTKILFRAAPRIVKLNLCVASFVQWHRVCRNLAPLGMPLLEDLNLDALRPIRWEGPPEKIQLVATPRLRSLTSTGILPIVPPSSCGHLCVLRLETQLFTTWPSSMIAQAVNQFAGLERLTFGGNGYHFLTGSHNPDLTLSCPKLHFLSILNTAYEFVVWILGVLEAPSLQRVHLTLPDEPSNEDEEEPVVDWDPWDAAPHEHVSELVISSTDHTNGPEHGYLSFLSTAFPNILHLEFPFGDMRMVEGGDPFWSNITSIRLLEEEPSPFGDTEYYERCLEDLLDFVRAYKRLRTLKIDGNLAMERPLTAQRTKQLADLVDHVQVGLDQYGPIEGENHESDSGDSEIGR